MPGGVREVHRDDEALATATHDGADGSATLRNVGADFKSCGVSVGLAIYNDTDGSNGLVTAVTEDEVTCTLAGGVNNHWNKDDTYSIYKTGTKNSVISSIKVDKSRGWKAEPEKDLDRGWRPEDVDLDRDTRHVFGPGQPERSHGD